MRLGVARTLSLIDAETDYYKSNQTASEGEEEEAAEGAALESEQDEVLIH